MSFFSLQLNPQHKIPTLKDGDFSLGESNVIMTYLVNKYGKEDSKLYPKDPQARAVVDNRLYFDTTTLYHTLGEVTYPKMFNGEDISEKAWEKQKEAWSIANDYVKVSGYVAGTDHLTLADLAWAATYSTAKAAGNIDLTAYPDLNAWYEKVTAEIKNYEKADGVGAAAFGEFYRSKLA